MFQFHIMFAIHDHGVRFGLQGQANGAFTLRALTLAAYYSYGLFTLDLHIWGLLTIGTFFSSSRVYTSEIILFLIFTTMPQCCRL